MCCLIKGCLYSKCSHFFICKHIKTAKVVTNKGLFKICTRKQSVRADARSTKFCWGLKSNICQRNTSVKDQLWIQESN